MLSGFKKLQHVVQFAHVPASQSELKSVHYMSQNIVLCVCIRVMLYMLSSVNISASRH